MNGLTDDMLESYMDDLKYREVIIGYKGNRYHIEAYNKKYVVGIFKKKEDVIDYFVDVQGVSNDDAYEKLICSVSCSAISNQPSSSVFL